jgi:DNA-binding MarR family transcriptional regulator
MPRTRRSTGPAEGPADTTAELTRLLPELAVALYESAPQHARLRPETDPPLTGRQMEAVVFLAHHGRATMGELAAGLGISRGAASELVGRLVDKGVVRREPDAADRRVVHVCLAGRAEALANETRARWRAELDAVFARFPGIDPEDLVAFLRTLIRQLKGRPDA